MLHAFVSEHHVYASDADTCIYVCMYTCTYIHIHTHTYTTIDRCAQNVSIVYMHIHTHTYTYIHNDRQVREELEQTRTEFAKAEAEVVLCEEREAMLMLEVAELERQRE